MTPGAIAAKYWPAGNAKTAQLGGFVEPTVETMPLSHFISSALPRRDKTLALGDRYSFNHGLQLAGLIHLSDDIATTH